MLESMWLLLAGLLLSSAAGGERPPAPSWCLPSAGGEKLCLEDLRGKVVVLNFWATWCKPCRQEIPALQKVRRDYRSEGVEVVGVAMDERGWPAVTPFLAGMGVEYPVLRGTAPVARRYGALKSLPVTVFIDRQGRIAARSEIALHEEALRRIVAALASEP